MIGQACRGRVPNLRGPISQVSRIVWSMRATALKAAALRFWASEHSVRVAGGRLSSYSTVIERFCPFLGKSVYSMYGLFIAFMVCL